MKYAIRIAPELVYPDVNMEPVGPSPDSKILLAEIDSLKVANVILKTSPYILFVCNLNGHPALRQELSRQREITFRSVGESTGKAYDTDEFDDYYEQLIIWDDVAHTLVGGYRFGCGDKIFNLYGRSGFYISCFFDIDPEFDPYLSQCVELGRSFIVLDYQRKNLPLYLLWKGILAYMVRHPNYRYLVGPVSISRYYSDFSRKLLMLYARRHFYHPHFAKWFTPKTPFNPVVTLAEKREMEEIHATTFDLDEVLDQLQPEHIQFPVLMKQYIRQNARFLGFNLDPNFNNALDGLMILDIADVPDITIELLQRDEK